MTNTREEILGKTEEDQLRELQEKFEREPVFKALVNIATTKYSTDQELSHIIYTLNLSIEDLQKRVHKLEEKSGE